MTKAPNGLDYSSPPTTPRRQESLRWLKRVDALITMPFGAVILAVGIGNLIALLDWRDGSWSGNLFVGIFGTLAGFAFFVRPLYRMLRGRNWWTVE